MRLLPFFAPSGNLKTRDTYEGEQKSILHTVASPDFSDGQDFRLHESPEQLRQVA